MGIVVFLLATNLLNAVLLRQFLGELRGQFEAAIRAETKLLLTEQDPERIRVEMELWSRNPTDLPSLGLRADQLAKRVFVSRVGVETFVAPSGPLSAVATSCPSTSRAASPFVMSITTSRLLRFRLMKAVRSLPRRGPRWRESSPNVLSTFMTSAPMSPSRVAP